MESFIAAFHQLYMCINSIHSFFRTIVLCRVVEMLEPIPTYLRLDAWESPGFCSWWANFQQNLA